MANQLFHHHLLKRLSFVESQLTICGSKIVDYSSPFICTSVFMPVPHCLGFVVFLEIRYSIKSPKSSDFILFQIVLAILDPVEKQELGIDILD